MERTSPFFGQVVNRHRSGHTRTTTTSHSFREKGSETAKTSFIDEGGKNVICDPRIFLANEKLKELYPKYRQKGYLNLETVTRKDGTTKVLVRGPCDGKYNLVTENGDINPKLPKTIFETLLGPTREQLQHENKQSIREAKDVIARNEEVANDQNEDKYMREQAREKIDEGSRRLAKLEKERITRGRGASALTFESYIPKIRLHSYSNFLGRGSNHRRHSHCALEGAQDRRRWCRQQLEGARQENSGDPPGGDRRDSQLHISNRW